MCSILSVWRCGARGSGAPVDNRDCRRSEWRRWTIIAGESEFRTDGQAPGGVRCWGIRASGHPGIRAPGRQGARGPGGGVLARLTGDAGMPESPAQSRRTTTATERDLSLIVARYFRSGDKCDPHPELRYGIRPYWIREGCSPPERSPAHRSPSRSWTGASSPAWTSGRTAWCQSG
jgi:hypothetical protein